MNELFCGRSCAILQIILQHDLARSCSGHRLQDRCKIRNVFPSLIRPTDGHDIQPPLTYLSEECARSVLRRLTYKALTKTYVGRNLIANLIVIAKDSRVRQGLEVDGHAKLSISTPLKKSRLLSAKRNGPLQGAVDGSMQMADEINPAAYYQNGRHSPQDKNRHFFLLNRCR